MCLFDSVPMPRDLEKFEFTRNLTIKPRIRWSDNCKITSSTSPPVIRKISSPETAEDKVSPTNDDRKYEYAASIEIYCLGMLRPHVRWSNDCKTSKNARPPYIRKIQRSHPRGEKLWRACADLKCKYAACNEFYTFGTFNHHVHWSTDSFSSEKPNSSTMKLLESATVQEYFDYDDRLVKAAAYERYAPSCKSTKRHQISGYLGISEGQFCKRFPHLDEDLCYRRWTEKVSHQIKGWAKGVLGMNPETQLPSPAETRFAI